MTPEVEARLRDHVARVLARAGVPAADRDDLREELLVHLVERWDFLTTQGMEPAAAADRVIADFGTAAQIGGEFGRTYHSRLWASTIGVLLPAVASPSSRPSAVRWLRFVLGLLIAVNIIAVAVLPSLSPFRLATTVGALILSILGLAAAFTALASGQRWALNYALWATVIMLLIGLLDLAVPRGDTVTIPLGSILAAAALLLAQNQWEALQRFVAGSERLRGPLAAAVAISLLAPIAPRVVAAVPDPTQATADDLTVRVEMTCRGGITTAFGDRYPNAPQATVVIDAAWARTDLLPLGFNHFLSGPDDADTSAIRMNDVEMAWLWSDDDGPTIVDLTTGDDVGIWGSTAQSVNLLPQDVIGTMTIGLEQPEIQPGHTIRMTWNLSWSGDGRPDWPLVDVYYAHLDRFMLAASVDCGDMTHAAPVRPGSIGPAEGGLPPLPL